MVGPTHPCVAEHSAYFGSLWEVCRSRQPYAGEIVVYPQAEPSPTTSSLRLMQT